MFRKIFVGCVAALGLAGWTASAGGATVFAGTASATFGTPFPTENVFYTGVGTNDFSTGVPAFGAQNNRYLIEGNAFSAAELTPFAVANLTYRNGQTNTGTEVISVPVSFVLSFTSPSGIGAQAFNFTFAFDFTPNGAEPVSNPLNDDLLKVENVQATSSFVYDNKEYTLRLLGFGADPNSLASEFRLPEDQITQSKLWAQIGEPIDIGTPVVPLPAGVWGGLAVLAGVAGVRLRRATAG